VRALDLSVSHSPPLLWIISTRFMPLMTGCNCQPKSIDAPQSLNQIGLFLKVGDLAHKGL